MASKSVSVSTTCAANSALSCTATITASESSTNTAGNYSTVHFTLVVKCTSSLSFTGGTRNHAGTYKGIVGGTTAKSGYIGMPNGMSNGQTLVNISWDQNITHSSDGSFNLQFGIDIDQADDDYGRVNYYWNNTGGKYEWLTLTTINKGGSSGGGSSGGGSSGGSGGSGTVDPVPIDHTIKPTISSVTFSESGTNASGESLTSLGVTSRTIIGGISKKTVTVRASANSGTLDYIYVSNGSVGKTAYSSPASLVFSGSELTSGTFTVLVRDSYGNYQIEQESLTFVDYTKPQVAYVTPERDSSTATTGKISSAGVFFNGKVGNVQNTVSVTITGTGVASASPTISGNTWSYSNVVLSGLQTTSSYTYTVTATDSLGYSDSVTATLQLPQAALWVGKHTVRVSRFLDITDDMRLNGKSFLDRTYPVGSIYLSATSTDPKNLFGGTWKQIAQGRMLIGVGGGYTAGATGGSETHNHGGNTGGHALTTNEMPSHRHGVDVKPNSSENNAYGLTPAAGFKGRVMVTPNGSYSGTIDTDYAGGGASHSHTISSANNMPPYLAVYIWQRTS